jgi:hypothetical protein
MLVKVALALALLLSAWAASSSGGAKPNTSDPPPCQPGKLC